MKKTTELRIEKPRVDQGLLLRADRELDRTRRRRLQVHLQRRRHGDLRQADLPGQVRPGLALAAQASARARAARARSRRPRRSAATSGSITSTRRGEATSRALSAVIARKTVASTSASQRRRQASTAEAEQAEGEQRPVQRLPDRLAHHVARPVRPDPPDLGGDEAGVFERLFGDVVPELFLAHPRERLVGFQVRDSGARRGAARICSSRSRSRVGGGEEFRVAATTSAPTFSGIAVRGQVGAGEEHLAAAGRDRHEAVEGDALRIVQGATTTTSAAASRIAAWASARRQSTRAPRAKTTSAEQEGDAQILRPDHRQSRRAGRPGSSQRGAPAVVAIAPPRSIASTAPESSVAASGSLISIPWYSSSAG